jgi:ceramide glucosyltransferase
MTWPIAIAGLFAAGALGIHVLSCLLAARRCRAGLVAPQAARLDPVSLIRPVCGLDHDARRTLESSFGLEHPDYEVIFCVSDSDDPALRLIEDVRSRHPGVPCRLLVGRDRFAHNPKLDNCAKGWEAARHDWIVMADSNIVLPPDYFARIATAEGTDTGLVSSPPAGGDPLGFWAQVECAVLNTYQARIQYAVDALGMGFAQGKTLSTRRSLLARAGGYAVLGSEPAEDAAATKAIRSLRLRVRLAGPPCQQPLGVRRWREVWSRQVRWARLRRASFPLLFVPEILSGGLLPFAAVLGVAAAMDAPLVAAATIWLAVWYGAEAALARAARWPLHWTTPWALLVRDLAIPAVWVAGWTGRSFSWRGASLSTDAYGKRVAGMTIATQFAVDCDSRAGDSSRLGEGVW